MAATAKNNEKKWLSNWHSTNHYIFRINFIDYFYYLLSHYRWEMRDESNKEKRVLVSWKLCKYTERENSQKEIRSIHGPLWDYSSISINLGNYI